MPDRRVWRHACLIELNFAAEMVEEAAPHQVVPVYTLNERDNSADNDDQNDNTTASNDGNTDVTSAQTTTGTHECDVAGTNEHNTLSSNANLSNGQYLSNNSSNGGKKSELNAPGIPPEHRCCDGRKADIIETVEVVEMRCNVEESTFNMVESERLVIRKVKT